MRERVLFLVKNLLIAALVLQQGNGVAKTNGM